MVTLRTVRLVLFFSTILIACSSNPNEVTNYERDFNKIAFVKIRESKPGQCLIDAISNYGLDSLGGPLKIIDPYYIRNYQINEEDINFSVVKDQDDFFHFIPLKQWSEIIFDKGKLYKSAEVDYSDLTKMNNFPMVLKDSIDLIEINIDNLEFIFSNQNFNFSKTSGAEFNQRFNAMLDILEGIEYPYLTNKVSIEKVNAYLDNHFVRSGLRQYLNDSTKIKTIVAYEEWFGYCLVVASKTRFEISLFCIPFEKRKIQFRSDNRRFNCW